MNQKGLTVPSKIEKYTQQICYSATAILRGMIPEATSLTGVLLGHLAFDIFIGYLFHDDVITWKHFPLHWPFICPPMTTIQRSLGDSPLKGQWLGTLNLLYLRLNKWLNKQPRCMWFETPSRSLWRQCLQWILQISLMTGGTTAVQQRRLMNINKVYKTMFFNLICFKLQHTEEIYGSVGRD